MQRMGATEMPRLAEPGPSQPRPRRPVAVPAGLALAILLAAIVANVVFPYR